MAGAAGAIHLPSCDARQANVRTFCAPDRTVAIIDGRGGAIERLAGRNDGGGKQQYDKHPSSLAKPIDFRSPAGVSQNAVVQLVVSLAFLAAALAFAARLQISKRRFSIPARA